MRILRYLLILIYVLAVAWFFMGWLLNDTQFRFMYDAGVDRHIIDGAKNIGRQNALYSFVFSIFALLTQLVHVWPKKPSKRVRFKQL